MGQILAGPIKIYYAQEGTAQPAPATHQPPSPWLLLANGKYDNGIEPNYAEERNEVQTMNETYPEEEFRSSERTTYTARLLDMRLETMALLMGKPLNDTAMVGTTPGYREFDIERGFRVAKHSILIVGQTPYEVPANDGVGLNLWHPRVTLRGPGGFSFNLADPSMPEAVINVLKHATLGVGGPTANYSPVDMMPTLTVADQAESVGAFSYTPTTTGGNMPFTFTATGLPSWASIDSATGEITGTAVAGVDTVVLTVRDMDGDTDTDDFTITIT